MSIIAPICPSPWTRSLTSNGITQKVHFYLPHPTGRPLEPLVRSMFGAFLIYCICQYSAEIFFWPEGHSGCSRDARRSNGWSFGKLVLPSSPPPTHLQAISSGQRSTS